MPLMSTLVSTGITRLPLSAVSDLVQRTISSNLAVRLGLSQLFWALIVRVASSASAVATDLIMKQLQVKGAGIPSACWILLGRGAAQLVSLAFNSTDLFPPFLRSPQMFTIEGLNPWWCILVSFLLFLAISLALIVALLLMTLASRKLGLKALTAFGDFLTRVPTSVSDCYVYSAGPSTEVDYYNLEKSERAKVAN